MNITSLLQALQSGNPQPASLLTNFIDGVAKGSVSNEDATSWLKAMHQFGCTAEDKVLITKCMMASGAILSWPEGAPVVDKHSTGGVGDKMSLILAPALAACGCRVPMLAGRGLGHTGGTIDKLESIPGFICSLSPAEMKEIVENIGCCIAVQNDAIAPADSVLYALRDITDTIDSVPLITASIISKKAAEGISSLVLDVKMGKAAFMKTIEQATELATSMVQTAQGLGIQTMAQITSMDEPIGSHIGNALEVIESIHVLQGYGSEDTRELVIMQGVALLTMSMHLTPEEALSKMNRVLSNGEALQKFKAMCLAQGVSEQIAERLIAHPEKVLGASQLQTTILAQQQQYIHSIDAMGMAVLAREHGAGRYQLDDVLSTDVGFVLHCKKGDWIQQDEPLFTFYHNRPLVSTEHERLSRFITGEIEPTPSISRLCLTIE